jgi:DHA2 family multidrug resistance protein
MVTFRLLQGMFGAALVPLSQSVLLDTYPREQQGQAMAIWGMGIMVGPILGPTLGGWLTENYNWRWVFYINLPVGLVSLAMTRAFVFDPAYIRRRSSQIDYWGIGMLAVGIGALQVMLDKGQEDDWFESSLIVGLAVIAAVALVAFVVRELRTRAPVVDLRVLKIRTYATGVFLMTVLGLVLYGSLVLLPIMLQTLLGYPAIQAGIAMAPRGMGSFVAMPIVGAILVRVGARKLLVTGLAVGGLTLLWLGSLNLQAGYWDIFWPQFVQGVSLGLLFVPLTTISMDPIPKETMGNATSIFNLMRNIGGSVGVALSTSLLARRQQQHAALLASHVSLYDPATRERLAQMAGRFAAAGADPATAAQRAAGALAGLVRQQAAMLSFIDVFRLLGVVFVLMVPLVFLMRPPRSVASGAAIH